MALYEGPTLGRDLVRLGPATTESGGADNVDADVRANFVEWRGAAQRREDILYFAIREGEQFIGQIFLHDIDRERGEALIDYHILKAERRGRGIGTQALALLVQYVREQTSLRKLVVITSQDNHASRRVAEKNGFAFAGAPREDPASVCLVLEILR